MACLGRVGLVVVFVSAVCPAALGQTAQLTGRITDSAAAVLPGAGITITHAHTGAAREIVSNGEGYFAAPFLPPGTYRLVVRAAGFRPFARDGLTLAADQALRVDVTMELGDIEIRIDAEASPLRRETASVAHLVDRHSIAALPLNGRNYFQLVLLAPGAVRNPASRPADGFNLNGQRTWQNAFLIDGLDNNNYILGGGTGSIQSIRPSLDAIEQVTVEGASYGAEHGRTAGGVISLVTKSGTNQYHGSAFEFLRHDALEATDFVTKRTGQPTGRLRHHQFGGSAGGPLARNRTFFFVSYQGTRERRTHTAVLTVPTEEMARGSFGPAAIFDPSISINGVRQPFANNTIPANRIDPVGRQIAGLFPSPNRPGTIDNFAGAFRRNEDQDQFDVRVDHHAGDRRRVFLRVSRSIREALTTSVFGPPGYGQPAVAGLTERQQVPGINRPRAVSFVAGETRVLSNAMVNELRAGYSANGADAVSLTSRPLFEEFGIGGIDAAGLTGLPVFTVQGFGVLGDRGNIPRVAHVRVLQVADHLSWVRGAHAVKAGADVRLTTNRIDQVQQARGEFVFNGQFTSRGSGLGAGSPFADLLLGQTSSARLSTHLTGDFRDQYYALYVSDSWKLRPSLTVSFGVRYDVQTPMFERHNRMSTFDLDRRSLAFGTLIAATGGGIQSRTFTKLDTNNIAPRLGFAAQIDSQTSVRGALGVFYAGLGFQEAQSLGTANLPHFVRVTFPSATDAATSSVVLMDGFPAGALELHNVRSPTASAVAPELPISEVRQWSAGVDREFRYGVVLSLNYIGSASSHLTALNNVNAPAPGPGPVARRRPFSVYGDIILSSDAGTASYHALQAKAERRFRNGFSVLASHTWSHTIDNATDVGDAETGTLPLPQNPNDTAAENASSTFDVRHRFVGSFTYGARDGWRVAGIFVGQTGVPMTPLVGTNPANTGTVQRPDCLRNGNLPRGKRNADGWFDVGAFAPAVPHAFGSCGRHVLRAPGFVNLDLLVSRALQIGGRQLELRAEAFNVLNRIHLGRPHLVITDPQAGRITSIQAPPRQIEIGVRFLF